MSPAPRELWSRVLLVGLSATAAPFLGGGWSTDDFAHLHRLLKHPTMWDMFASPDSFGFYRPVAQTTFLAEALLHGLAPVAFRATNLIIHILVVLVAYRFARQLLDRRAAFLAVAAFALTPKAHPIAILWVSARPELLMSFFSFAALISWVEWEGQGGFPWLAASGVSYLLALLSKETAALLPLLLFLTPPRGPLLTRRRLLGSALLFVLAAVPIGLRVSAGALMPLTRDTNYSWSLSLYRWFRATGIYVPRTLPSPAALLIVVAIPAALAMRRIEAMPRLWDTSSRRLLAYAVAWFFVFIAPVLPVAGRSELYLYLAGFGFCLVAGQLTDRALAGSSGRPIIVAAMVLYILGLGGYQVVRETQSHQVSQFTGALVQSMQDDPWLRTYRGRFVLVPADPETERLLRDGIGDYLYLVLEDTFGRVDINGLTAYADRPAPASDGPRIVCAYDGKRVSLRQN